MMLPIVVVMICLAFFLQLWLCFGAKRLWIKLTPLYLIAIGELACAVVYIWFDGTYGAAFAAVIYAIVLLIMLAGDALAWLIYAIVKKHKKTNKIL